MSETRFTFIAKALAAGSLTFCAPREGHCHSWVSPFIHLQGVKGTNFASSFVDHLPSRHFSALAQTGESCLSGGAPKSRPPDW